MNSKGTVKKLVRQVMQAKVKDAKLDLDHKSRVRHLARTDLRRFHNNFSCQGSPSVLNQFYLSLQQLVSEVKRAGVTKVNKKEGLLYSVPPRVYIHCERICRY